MATPTNVTQLKSARATAGTRYAAAVAELEAALKDLAALDIALANQNVLRQGGPNDYPTFSGEADNLPQSLRHPQFGAYSTGWRDVVKANADLIIRTIAG